MPRFRRSGATRRTRGPKQMRRKRRGLSTRRIAIRALKSTDQERKFQDIRFQNVVLEAPASGQPTFFVLNAMGQGVDAESNRIGNKISMSSILAQLYIQADPADETPAIAVRLHLVYDKQPNNALPQVADFLQSIAVQSTVDVFSPLDLDNNRRFNVMYTKYFTLTALFPVKVIKFYKKLSQSTRYNGNGTAIGAIETGSLLWVMFSDKTADQPQCDGYMRLRYVG